MVLYIIVFGSQIILIEEFVAHNEHVGLIEFVLLKQIWRKKEKVESWNHVLFLFERIFLGGNAGEVGEIVISNTVFNRPYVIVQNVFVVFVVTWFLIGFADQNWSC